MLEISRREGKILNQKCPKYVMVTSHKRHYYLVENKKALCELKKIRKNS